MFLSEQTSTHMCVMINNDNLFFDLICRPFITDEDEQNLIAKLVS